MEKNMKKVLFCIAFIILLTPISASASFNQSKELDEVDRRIASSTRSLQSQIDNLNWQLLQLKTANNNQEKNVIVNETVIDEVTEQRITNLETKVGTLQSAVDFLQNKIIGVLNIVVDFLSKLSK